MQVIGDEAPTPEVPTLPSSGGSPAAPEAGGIRNIVQTHSEYPIIKMVPDAVVYIDNLPYLINDYVGRGGIFVNINDYVTSIGGAVDVGSWIPTCNITLSIPNDLKYLLQAPGGQRILKSMADIKVFAKGYYLTPKGESVYHRVFWGVVSNVTYTDTRKTLEVSMTCNGIMHLFDLMQFNGATSAQNAVVNSADVVGYADKTYSLNAFEVILETFLAPLSRDVIDQETVVENNAVPPEDTFKRAYASKWNAHLLNMQKAVRLFGLTQQSIAKVESFMAADPACKDAGITSQGRTGAMKATKDEVDRGSIVDDKMVRDFLPNYRIGSINLLQSAVTTRLARVQALVEMIGWEGYQDLDGSIVIKPPLYNLDCTNTTLDGPNPFVINLPEVIGSEIEVEDETQVRLTRLTVHGLLTDQPILGDGNENIIPHATFMDPGLVRQFGLRQEPSKGVPYVANHPTALYAYAVSELTKINKNWRTYNVTIPFRPELRLGFSIFVPHLDIYAYLENISWTYQRGGSCTMTLSGTNVRYRELFAKEKETKEKDGSTTKQWIYTSVPNLEWVWCAANKAQPIDPQNRISTDPTGSQGTSGVVLPEQELTGLQEAHLMRKHALQSKMQTEADDKTNAWRVSGDSGKFSSPRPVDDGYYNIIVHQAMPYTDEKGYVLLRPFPWGRFMPLEKALDTFTRPEDKRTGKLMPFEEKDWDPDSGERLVYTSSTLAERDGFLMAGLGTPSVSSTDPTKGTPTDKAIMSTLKVLQETIEDDLGCFVLRYDTASGAIGASPNPYNAPSQWDSTGLQPGGTPAEGEEAPSPNPIQRATAMVNGFTGQSDEGSLSQ